MKTTNYESDSHGSAIDHAEAKQIGLVVRYLPPDDEAWKRIWLLYSMYDFDCRQRDYLKIFESDRLSNSIAAPLESPPASAATRSRLSEF
jgi:hypothetical protein